MSKQTKKDVEESIWDGKYAKKGRKHQSKPKRSWRTVLGSILLAFWGVLTFAEFAGLICAAIVLADAKSLSTRILAVPVLIVAGYMVWHFWVEPRLSDKM